MSSLPRDLNFRVHGWTRVTPAHLAQMRKLLAQHKSERAEYTLLRRCGEERAAGRELLATQQEVRDRSNMWTLRKDEVDRRRMELDTTITEHEALVAGTDRKISALKTRAAHERNLIVDTESEISRLLAHQSTLEEQKHSEFCAYQGALEDRNFLEDVWRLVHDSAETPSPESLDSLIGRIGNLETQNSQLQQSLQDLHGNFERLRLQAAEQPLKTTVARLESEAFVDALATKKAALMQTLTDASKRLESLADSETALTRRIVAVDAGLAQIFDRVVAVCPYASRQRALAEQRGKGDVAALVAVIAERLTENQDFLAEAATLAQAPLVKPPSGAGKMSENVQIVRGGRAAPGGTGSAMSTSRSAANSSKSMTF